MPTPSAHAPTVDRRWPGLSLVARISAVAVLAVAGLLAGTVPAQAHAALVSSDPADGSHFTTPPTQVTLTFNEDIAALGTQIDITCEQGGDHATGETEVNGTTVTRGFDYADMPGSFTVTWRAVSADGHPISGTFTFSVVPDAAASTAAGSATGAPSQSADSPMPAATSTPTQAASLLADSAAGGSGTSGGASPWAGWVAAGVILVAAVIALLAQRRHYRSHPRSGA